MKSVMPAGTYWDPDASRYVEPTDPDWSAEKFEAIAERFRDSRFIEPEVRSESEI